MPEISGMGGPESTIVEEEKEEKEEEEGGGGDWRGVAEKGCTVGPR